MFLPLPEKYFPQTKQAYTFKLDNVTEHNFSKSKSKQCLLIVPKYGQSFLDLIYFLSILF